MIAYLDNHSRFKFLLPLIFFGLDDSEDSSPSFQELFFHNADILLVAKRYVGVLKEISLLGEFETQQNSQLRSSQYYGLTPS